MRLTIKIIPAALIILFTSGCASLFQGTEQFVMPKTLNDAQRTETTCTMTNQEGSWTTPPYTNNRINRDNNPMSIVCENDSQIGETLVQSEFQIKWAALNFIMDLCIISCPVDMLNNAIYNYPAAANIVMHDKQKSSEEHTETKEIHTL